MNTARAKKRAGSNQRLPSLKRRRLGSASQKKEKPDPTKKKKGHSVETKEFYESLRPPFDLPMCEQPPNLSVPLFHYQRRAVHWMVQRERNGASEGCAGGILADEMGLGKTISALGTILSNPRKSNFNIEKYGPWSHTNHITQIREDIPTEPRQLRVSARQQAKKNEPALSPVPLPTKSADNAPMAIEPVDSFLQPNTGKPMFNPLNRTIPLTEAPPLQIEPQPAPSYPSFIPYPPHLPRQFIFHSDHMPMRIPSMPFPNPAFSMVPPYYQPNHSIPMPHPAAPLQVVPPQPTVEHDSCLMLRFKLKQPLNEIIDQAPEVKTPKAPLVEIEAPSMAIESEPTPLFDSKATLIIAPLILIKQWNSEIEKHTRHLKVMIYKGFKHLTKKELKKSERKNIFHKYDIVLTDYNTLRTELHFSKKSTKQLRTESKKFYSPLIGINWWRICIDEAQEVKTSSTQVSQMASTIPARNRWAITGTPIKTSFDDLLGTLIFLHCANVWKCPTSEVLSFLKKIAWRYEKKDVEDEITIPKPKEVSTIVNLTRFDTICEEKLTAKLPEVDALNVAARHVLSKFKSAPFFVMLNDVLQKKTSPKLADRTSAINALITETTNELFQSQVAICNCLNQLANLKSKNRDIEGAKECFMKSLDLGLYKVGTLAYQTFVQLDNAEHVLSPPVTAGFSSVTYHACINLALLLNEDATRDESDLWLAESEAIKRNALHGAQQIMNKARTKWNEVSIEATLMAKNRLRSSYGPWWIRALNFIASVCRDQFIDQLRRGVKQGYSTKFHEMTEHTLRMPDLNSIEDLKVQLAKDIDLIYRARSRCLELMKKPLLTDREQLGGSQQLVLDMESAMVHYEHSLAQKQIVKRGNVDQEVKMLALSERVLLYLERVIIDYYNMYLARAKDLPAELTKQQRMDQEILNNLSLIALEGEAYFRELEVMKIEVAFGGKLIDECAKYIKTWKELEDKSGSPVQAPPSQASSKPPEKIKKRRSAKIRKSISDLKNEEEPREEILLSSEALETKLASLETQCISTKALLSELYSISQQVQPPAADFGSKLQAVIKEVVDVLAADPNAKILIFSAWPEALEQLGALLAIHMIRFSGGVAGITSGGSSISGRIDNFRLDPTLNVLLLNAVKQSTGLTLTMANQIFLLDPLDQANEVQAIGRAYRIGQQKQTIIRRFLIATEEDLVPMLIEPQSQIVPK